MGFPDAVKEAPVGGCLLGTQQLLLFVLHHFGCQPSEIRSAKTWLPSGGGGDQQLFQSVLNIPKYH